MLIIRTLPILLICATCTALAARAGDIAARAGDIAARAGDIAARAGDIAARAGDIAARAGDIAARAGDIAARAGDIAARAGDIAARAGDIAARAGDIAARAGDIAARAGDIAARAGDIAARGDAVAARFAGQGELILVKLDTAPFPHPKREQGHRYEGKLYSAKEHYADNTVAIFVPRGFRETGKIDFIVHFHGWQNHVERVLERYRLIEQLVASGRNAVLVVPQGPRDSPDSFGGKLEDAGGFKRFMDDVAETLRRKSALKKKDFAVGKIVLSGHSGGFEVIAEILDRGGLTEQVREVWLFDALYGRTPKFLAWIDRKQGRFIDIYTDHGGTKTETEQLMALLKKRGTPYFAAEESESKPGDLKSPRIVFLHTAIAHDEVMQKREAFRDFLATSCLAATASSKGDSH